MKFFFISILFFCQYSFVNADENSLQIQNRKNKAVEQCKIDPLDPKCEKLLDSTYRKLKDSEKEFKEDKLERYSEQKAQSQSRSELRTFCRTTPDSIRCKALKSK